MNERRASHFLPARLGAITSLLCICLFSPQSQCANFAYSVDGELLSAEYSSQTISYEYDASGNLAHISALASGKVFSPLDLWRESMFSTTENSGAAADLSITNGVPNIVRFALGLSLNDPLSLRYQYSADDNGINITYWARSDMPSLAVQLETSTDLATWTPGNGAIQIGTETNYNRWQSVLPANQRQIFWRVTATIQP